MVSRARKPVSQPSLNGWTVNSKSCFWHARGVPTDSGIVLRMTSSPIPSQAPQVVGSQGCELPRLWAPKVVGGVSDPPTWPTEGLRIRDWRAASRCLGRVWGGQETRPTTDKVRRRPEPADTPAGLLPASTSGRRRSTSGIRLGIQYGPGGPDCREARGVGRAGSSGRLVRRPLPD